MDTKWKNIKLLRWILGAVAVLLVTCITLGVLPVMSSKFQDQVQSQPIVSPSVDAEIYRQLCQDVYVLYGESLYQGTEDSSLLNKISASYDWVDQFSMDRMQFDYFIRTEYGDDQNNSQNLSVLLDESKRDGLSESLLETYGLVFVLEYDETGSFSILYALSAYTDSDDVIKYMQSVDRDMWDTTVYDAEIDAWTELERPASLQVVFGVSYATLEEYTYNQWSEYEQAWSYFNQEGVRIFCWGMLGILIVVMLILTSKSIWKASIDYQRKSWFYGAEAAVVYLAVVIFSLHNLVVDAAISYYFTLEGEGILDILMNGNLEKNILLGQMFLLMLLIYGGWYLALLLIRPVFSLGLKQYIREYSLLYKLWKAFRDYIKKQWRKLVDEINHTDLKGKGMKTIIKLVIVNFLILAAISLLWFVGIFALIIYSLILLWLLKRQYDRIQRDYKLLMDATSQIAEGNLKEPENSADWGLFEPFKDQLTQIRSGFSCAVEQEVKSQRMKTELITNVSHDLKTPLTAITTYVELLKDPNLTPEQRDSYVETLERKALRLKVLIEDLFEVSKAASKDIKLDLMLVDVVNLLKQVSVEHQETFQEKGLELRWNLPEERAVALLDNQKTYRVFENLFVNVEKYAMPGSRVYLDVTAQEKITITLKNMSAQELNVAPLDLTERFVRGDQARNTEGSGLGLAIAKSFVEAQKGTLDIQVDGDLFKVIIELAR